MDHGLAETVARHSMVPSGASLTPNVIVLARPGDDLSTTFALARQLVSSGHVVRLVGHGVTLPRTWPSWVPQAADLVLTELGAYRMPTHAPEMTRLRRRYLDWVEKVFDGAAPAGSAGEVYYAPAATRIFQRTLDLHLLVGGIAVAHPSARVVTVDGECGPLDEASLYAGDDTRTDSLTARAFIPPLFAIASLGAIAFAVADCAKRYREASFARRRLAARRRETVTPTTWAGVVPDWWRASKHLVEGIALPEVEQSRPLGVLLLGTLRASARDEVRMGSVTVTEAEAWSGLGPLRDMLDTVTIDQAVQPLDLGSFVAASAAGLGRALGVVAGMMHDLEPVRGVARREGWVATCRAAAASVTVDVIRSTLAEHATKDLLERRSVEGVTFVLAAANSVGFTVVDRVLRDAGATTIEHLHGSGGGYWHGAGESFATMRSVWTESDGRQLAALGQRSVVAGMPTALRLERRSRGTRRILLLSNYVHRDWIVSGRFPAEPFLHELLRAAVLLRNDDIEIRWRPHPADADVAVRRAHAAVPFVELSRARPLDEDLNWCDVLVSTQSTALVEALLHGVTSFVHITPEYERPLDWVPKERGFFRAEQMKMLFDEWREAVRRNDDLADSPERAARMALFGEPGAPRTLRDAIR